MRKHHGTIVAASLMLTVLPAGCIDGEEDTAGPEADDVASVTVTPDIAVVAVNQSMQFEATVVDSRGNVLTREVRWTSDDADVATVDPSGLATGVAPGSATITATSAGEAGTAELTVTNPSGSIVVDPTATHQTIVGWEATAEIGQGDFQPAEFRAWRDEVADSAVAIGINRLRVEIKSGIENTADYFSQWRDGRITRDEYARHWYDPVNDNDDPFSADLDRFHFSALDETIQEVVVPLRQRLAAVGERLYVNLIFVDFSRNSAFEHREDPDEYAELILTTFRHIQSNYGWVPDAAEVILEPNNGGWSGRQVGEAVAAAGARLEANGFTPDFIAPSTSSLSGAIADFDEMIQVSGVSPYLSELSYHRYGGVSDDNLRRIAERARDNGIRAAMLEHIGSGHEDLHKDLTLGRNSAWQQFVLAFPVSDNGAQYLLVDRSTATVSLASRTKFLRQYFKFVRSGARRIDVSSHEPGLEPVAFINADDNYVVVVKASGAASFTVGGLPSGRYGISYTTSSAHAVDAGEIDLVAGELDVDMPAAGVITVYGKN